MFLKEPLGVTCCTKETDHSVFWLCELINLSIRHFEDSTEIQLKSWWKLGSLWSTSSLKKEAAFISSPKKRFYSLVLNFTYFDKFHFILKTMANFI